LVDLPAGTYILEAFYKGRSRVQRLEFKP
jgi:hypothetical protein